MCRGIKPISQGSISIDRKELIVIGLLLLLLSWRHNRLVQYVLAIVLHLQVIPLLQLHPGRGVG